MLLILAFAAVFEGPGSSQSDWDAFVGVRSGAVAQATFGASATSLGDQQCNPQQVQKILPSDGAPGDLFGNAVGICGDIMILGARTENSFIGAAYIFQGDGSGAWSEIDKLIPRDGGLGDQFGTSVGISGDAAIVGAPHVNNSVPGAAYLFHRDRRGGWVEIAKVNASDAAPSVRFGHAVAISGDTAVVGAPRDNENGTESGAAYIFRDDGTGTWVQIAKITASDAAAFDQFGYAVAICGQTAIIGARGDDDNGSSSGSAYLFADDGGGNWTEIQEIRPAHGDSGDQFGFAVALSGDTAVIGAASDENSGTGTGSAYIFRDAGDGNWMEVDKIIASDGGHFDRFGFSVGVDGSTVIVGSDRHDGIGSDAGSAYIFLDDGSGDWQEVARLNASDGANFDEFGHAVTVSGELALVGAHHHQDNGGLSGAAYVFDLNCTGCHAEITAAEVTFGAKQGPQDPAKLTADDDDRTIATSTVFLSALEPNLAVLQVTADASACLGQEPVLATEIQDHAGQPNVTVRVRLAPAGGGSPVQVGQYAASFGSDEDHEIDVADASEFIAGDGAIVMELRYSTIALISPLGFEARTDRVLIALE